jgi:alpha-tubulin suppressor-like RCC1 family protein
MAITDMGKLYTWGFGEQGALGHNSTNDCFVPKELDLNRRLAPYKRDPSNIIVVLDAAGGAQHSIALVKEFRKA